MYQSVLTDLNLLALEFIPGRCRSNGLWIDRRSALLEFYYCQIIPSRNTYCGRQYFENKSIDSTLFGKVHFQVFAFSVIRPRLSI
jgi:hypothetical protein